MTYATPTGATVHNSAPRAWGPVTGHELVVPEDAEAPQDLTPEPEKIVSGRASTKAAPKQLIEIEQFGKYV